MPGLTSGLYIGLSGLQAAQGALTVVGNNITNVNTENYTRQQATLTSNQSQVYGALEFGTGVSLTNIIGVRDKYLELQITQATSKQAGASTRYSTLEAISTVFEDDGSTGLSSLLQNYFEAFQELAASPESSSVRTSVVGQAQSLVDGLQARYQELEEQRTAADRNVGSSVEEINTLTQQIAELNQRVSTETTEGSDSSARDQRQALVNDLAGLVGIQAYEDSSGALQISLDSGTAVLVGGNRTHTMAVDSNGHVTVDMGGSSAVDVTDGISQGSLGAYLDLRDNVLPGYEAQLDTLAAGIINQTNALHRTGYALDGATTGLDFLEGSSVMTMTVNSAIVDDPSLIAASDTAASVGNNEIANQIADLQNGSFSSMITSLVSDIGTDVQRCEAATTTQENLLSALQTQRDSVSGVDVDEEAVKLITYQRAYQASANFVSTLDDLLEQLITQLGA